MKIETTKSILSIIEEFKSDIPGFSPVDQLYTLFSLLFTAIPEEGDIIEIGTWCGLSAITMGLALKLKESKQKVHCIDLFPTKDDWFQNEKGTYSFSLQLKGKEYKGYTDQTVFPDVYENHLKPLYAEHPSLLELFKEKINKYSMENVCKIHHMSSADFFNEITPDFKCAFAFIDGDHSEKGVSFDIEKVDRVLVPGGWICFDDSFSGHYPGVDKAITDLVINNPNYINKQQMTRKFFIAQKKM